MFKRFLCFLLGEHHFTNECSLPVSRVYKDKSGELVIVPDHWRMWCPHCRAIKRVPICSVPAQ